MVARTLPDQFRASSVAARTAFAGGPGARSRSARFCKAAARRASRRTDPSPLPPAPGQSSWPRRTGGSRDRRSADWYAASGAAAGAHERRRGAGRVGERAGGPQVVGEALGDGLVTGVEVVERVRDAQMQPDSPLPGRGLENRLPD
ncbi:hypothetical protein Cco03nite_82220 [Catellatospora coxensis]|uniref:Uncharacterized protein n=1 Tax=Catellatospora coxensis TaxID=310354 RepID=A0A8J3PC16_9ACTN|nr:hypothetical protein Cco03nite_82220 [Catellatospora coxensis]